MGILLLAHLACFKFPFKNKPQKLQNMPTCDIQFVHSFEVNIRIFQPENSDVHHFRGLTNPDVNQKKMYQLFCYNTLSFFS